MDAQVLYLYVHIRYLNFLHRPGVALEAGLSYHSSNHCVGASASSPFQTDSCAAYLLTICHTLQIINDSLWHFAFSSKSGRERKCATNEQKLHLPQKLTPSSLSLNRAYPIYPLTAASDDTISLILLGCV